MTDRELLQMALDALECWQRNEDCNEPMSNILEALRTALAQPEPEPVAWRRSNWSGSDDDYVYRDYDDPLLNTKGENVGEPLYTAPPQREWVGLTDAERADCSAEAYGRHFVLCELIEAKLKEKNND